MSEPTRPPKSPPKAGTPLAALEPRRKLVAWRVACVVAAVVAVALEIWRDLR